MSDVTNTEVVADSVEVEAVVTTDEAVTAAEAPVAEVVEEATAEPVAQETAQEEASVQPEAPAEEFPDNAA